MALRAIKGLIKFENFMRDLGLTYYQAIGILEALWHFTATNAIQGDIGRHPNEDIAAWIGYTGDANRLIEVLTTRRWLEPHPKHRLIVHDWHTHADKSVKATLKNRGLGFCMPEELIKTPEKIIGNQNLESGSLSGSGSGSGSEYGAGAEPSPPPIFENLPEPLKTDQFKSVWMRWEGYQDERYQRKLDSGMRSESWGRILTHAPPGSESAYGVATIQQSISEGWKGLHPKEPQAKMAKAATVPIRKHEDLSIKRAEAEKIGQSMLADGAEITAVMNELSGKYGSDIAHAAANHAGWKLPEKPKFKKPA